MKSETKGDSTLIILEEGDRPPGIEPKDRKHVCLDEGGEVFVCLESGECRSFSRPSQDKCILK